MKLIHCLLWLLPFGAAAQKIKFAGYDKFVRQTLVETEPLNVVNTADANLSFAFTSSSADVYLQASGSDWGSATIDANDALMLRLSNGSEVKARSTGLQPFTPSPTGSSYHHEYKLGLEDLDLLSRYDVTSVRKYMFSEFTDLKIPTTGAAKLKNLSALFLREISKMAAVANKHPAMPVVKPVHQIELRDIGKHIGDTVVFCANVFITRFYESSQYQASILDFQNSLSVPKVRAILWNVDQAKFGNLPKAFYTAKQVCVKGLVYLYDNTPYIRLSDKSQIKIMSPVTTDEAHFLVNDSVTLTGTVENVVLKPSANRWLLLQLRSPTSKQIVNIFIKEQNASADASPEKVYLHKTVQVSGKISFAPTGIQMVLANENTLRINSIAN